MAFIIDRLTVLIGLDTIKPRGWDTTTERVAGGLT